MRWLALLVTVLVAWGLTCFYTVDQTEFAVIKRLGDPVQTRIEPGLGIKYPWPIDVVVRLDNRLMVLEKPSPGEPDKEYLTEDEQSGIGKNVVVTTFTCWRIRPEPRAVLRFLETMGSRAAAEVRLGDVVVSELGTALGENDFAVLISTDPQQRRWDEFVENIRRRCQQDVADYGIEIVDVRIQRLNFPEQNRRNVFDRMRAERETIAARYRSEGDEQATTIRARADRQREEILARAQEEATRTRGAADAEAARIYAQAYEQDREFYQFLRTLEAYEKSLDEMTTLVLTSQSDFLRLFDRALPQGRADEGREPASQPAEH